MPENLRKRDRLIYGVLLPIAIMIVGLLFIMTFDSRSGAAEFAALGIYLAAIAVSPFVLIANLVIAFQVESTKGQCLKLGMIAPGLVMIGAILFQLGLLDGIF